MNSAKRKNPAWGDEYQGKVVMGGKKTEKRGEKAGGEKTHKTVLGKRTGKEGGRHIYKNRASA